MKKRLLALLFAATMSITTIAGCGKLVETTPMIDLHDYTNTSPTSQSSNRTSTSTEGRETSNSSQLSDVYPILEADNSPKGYYDSDAAC